MRTRTPLQSACKQYEEDLVLHYYGDNSDNERRGIERHLAACDSCRCFLDDLRKLLPQITQAEEMPQSFWDNYYRETVSKLASYEERKYWWRSIFAPLRTWMVPAFGTVAAAVLVIGLTLGKDDLRLFVEPRVQRIPQEILADKNQLDFFESMDILEALSKLEDQDEPKTDATKSDAGRASAPGRIV
jgi:hypothetical protein